MDRKDFETTRAFARRQPSAQASDEKPYLLGISGEHAGRSFPLEGLASVTIGRLDECDIACRLDAIVSRRNCRIENAGDGEYRIVDLGSMNGTLVNGREFTGTVLRRGDRVFLGEATIFKFDFLSDAERERWDSASFDPLTDCFNRAFFDRRFPELVELARSAGQPLALMMIDADHFKRVNDLHGHQCGDHVLHEIAATLDQALARDRTEALSCRYGGEEFAVVLPGMTAASCREAAEGVRAAVAGASYEFEGTPLPVTVSIGAASFASAAHAAADQLLREADQNLYRAKAEGRNRVVGPPD